MGKTSGYLTVFIGMLVAAGVWSWPEAPLWQCGPGAGNNFGFSPDAKVLVTSSYWPNGENQVTRWDARSGRILSQAEMACDERIEPMDMRRVWPSQDGSLALVGQGVRAKDSSALDLSTGEWFLHDGTTGRRILGPIEGVNDIGRDPFSPDNRWFVAYRGEPNAGIRQLDRPGIYATESGKCIVDLSKGADREGVCRFAPDGNSVAVCWYPNSKLGDQQPINVEIVELPSGRLTRRVEFRPQSWHSMMQWDGRFLSVFAHQPGERRQIVYDFAQDPVGEGSTDPLLRDYIDQAGGKVHWAYHSGPSWVVHFTDVPPGARQIGIGGWLDSLLVRLGHRQDFSKHHRANVHLIDRVTGQTRYELPHPVRISLMFSADGKLLACGDDSLEVWDTDPPPRWPKAIAWGFIAAGVVILLGRWRRRPTASPPASRSPAAASLAPPGHAPC